MLRATKHLDSLPDRPFAAAQGDKGTPPVMLSVAKHLDALPDRPFATLRVTRDLCQAERSEASSYKITTALLFSHLICYSIFNSNLRI